MTRHEPTHKHVAVALDWVETSGGFGDWRCRACFASLDPNTEDGRTLRQVIIDLARHFEVCDA